MPVPRDGDRISPSGHVVLRGRRGVIERRPAKGTCTWCSSPVQAPRRSWCSEFCVDAHRATQPDRQRALVEARDHERCQRCGMDCKAFRADVLARCSSDGRWSTRAQVDALVAWLGEQGRATSRRLGDDLLSRRIEWWDVDHVVPIWEGGHPYDLRNLRTLCPWCHQDETAEGTQRRTERRHGVRDQGAQQALFAPRP